MTDVFISYSRKDKEFVSQLLDALAIAEREVWVDWEDIPRGSDWMHEIIEGIDNANAFIFVVSPNSLQSEVCNQELTHAIKKNKRIIPAIYQDITNEVMPYIAGFWFEKDWETDARENWKTIRSLNWIFFNDPTKFQTEFDALNETLDYDGDHLREHTRLNIRADEWHKRSDDRSALLIGTELTVAEQWLADAITKNKEPQPTDDVIEYIKISRQQEDEWQATEQAREDRIRQFQRMAMTLMVVGVLAIGATIFSIVSLNSANEARDVAESQRVIAENAAAQAADEMESANNVIGTAQFNATQSAIDLKDVNQTLQFVPPTLTSVANQVIDVQTSRNALDLVAIASNILSDDAQNFEYAVHILLESLNVQYTRVADLLLQTALSWLGTEFLIQADTTITDVEFIQNDTLVMYTLFSSTDAKLFDVRTQETYTIPMPIQTDDLIGTTYLKKNKIGHLITAGLGSQTIYIIDEYTFEPVAEVTTSHPIAEFDVHPNEPHVAWLIGVDDTIKVVNYETDEVLLTIQNTSNQDVTDVAFSVAGNYVVVLRRDATYDLWDVDNQEITNSGALGGDFASKIAYIDEYDGAIISRSQGDDITALFSSSNLARIFDNPVGNITDFGVNQSLNRDGLTELRLFATSLDGTARVWDIVGEQQFFFNTFNAPVASAINDTNTRLAVADGAQLRILNTNPSYEIDRFLLHTNVVSSTAFSTDSKTFASADIDGNLLLWDIETNQLIRQFGRTDLPVLSLFDVRFTDESLWITGNNLGLTYYSLVVADLETYELTTVFDDTQQLQTIPELTQDFTQAFIGAYDNKLGFVIYDIDAQTFEINRTIQIPDLDYVGRLELTNNDEQLVVLTDTQLLVMNVESETIISRVQFTSTTVPYFSYYTDAYIYYLAVTPDGTSAFVTVGDGTRLIGYDLQTGDILSEFVSSSVVTGLFISPDGQYTLVTDEQFDVQIFPLTENDLLRVIGRHTDQITHISVSPDGKWVGTGSRDYTSAISPFDIADMREYACSRLPLDVSSSSELQTLMGGVANSICDSVGTRMMILANDPEFDEFILELTPDAPTSE